MINKNLFHDTSRTIPNICDHYSCKDKDGNNVWIEISYCHTEPKQKRSLPNLWFKAGYTKKPIYDYICIDTQVDYPRKDGWTDSFGNVYNPQVYKGQGKLNFDWMLEDTPENREKLLNEVYRRSQE
jgi:hypothetical protein